MEKFLEQPISHLLQTGLYQCVHQSISLFLPLENDTAVVTSVCVMAESFPILFAGGSEKER